MTLQALLLTISLLTAVCAVGCIVLLWRDWRETRWP